MCSEVARFAGLLLDRELSTFLTKSSKVLFSDDDLRMESPPTLILGEGSPTGVLLGE